MRRARHTGAAVVLGLVVATATATAMAAPSRAPRATLEVEPRETPVGHPFWLRILVDHPPGMELELPHMLSLPGEVHELERREGPARYAEETTRRTFEIRLIAFELGQHYLSPVTIAYTGKGFGGQVTTNGAFIEVKSGFEGAEPELRPAAPPVAVMERDLSLLLYGSAAVIGLLLLVAVVRAIGRFGRRRRVVFASPEAMAGSPQDAALARLRDLADSGLLDRPDRRPLYFAMSEALREFLGRVYGFEALELTTSELLAALNRFAPPMAWRVSLADWLEETDLVKYAGVRATRAVAADCLDRAMELVESVPAVTPVETGEGPPPAETPPPAEVPGE